MTLKALFMVFATLTHQPKEAPVRRVEVRGQICRLRPGGQAALLIAERWAARNLRPGERAELLCRGGARWAVVGGEE